MADPPQTHGSSLEDNFSNVFAAAGDHQTIDITDVHDLPRQRAHKAQVGPMATELRNWQRAAGGLAAATLLFLLFLGSFSSRFSWTWRHTLTPNKALA